MRRALTIAIVLLFSLTPLCALVPGAEQAALPACCRRHGAHHCAMQAAESQALQAVPGFAAQNHCPQYRVQVRAITPAFLLPSLAASRSVAHLRLLPASSNRFATRRLTPHAGRGPPALS